MSAASHVEGVHRHFIRAADGSVSFTGDAADMPAFDEERFVPVEVKAGSLVLLHGANVHLRWDGWGRWAEAGSCHPDVACCGSLPTLACSQGRSLDCCPAPLTTCPPRASCRSKENSSPLSRHAYAVHFVEGVPGFEWQSNNWLQRPADMPFEPLLPEQQEAAPAAAAGARQPAYTHARGSGQRVAAGRPAAAPAAGAARSARPY